MKNLVEKHANKNPRLKCLFVLFCLMFLFLISGLAFRQLIQNKDYLLQEKKQNFRRIIKPAPRGEIFDREGRLLVGNRPLFSVAIYLSELRYAFKEEYYKRVRSLRQAHLKVNSEKLAQEARASVVQKYIEQLNTILGKNITISQKELERHFKQRLLLPMTLLRDLSVQEYAKLTEQLPLESPLQLIVDSTRYYPYGSLAAHALGYVSITSEVSDKGLPGKDLRTFSFKGKEGKKGVELYFNEYLQGTSGWEIWLVDPSGFQYLKVDKQDAVKGKSLTLSLDIDLQMAAEKALQGKRGAVVAIEIKTGELLALVSSPTFDLNELTPFIPQQTFNAISERSAWINRAIQGFYPPASPFKIITAIACLKEKIISPEDVFHCDSGFLVGNRMFAEHENRNFGPVDLKRSIQISSNVYFYPAAIKLGPEKLAKEARNFGLDEPTGIEIPYEGKRMFVPDPKWKLKCLGESWRGGDTANMSIGQGYLSCSPIQMACFAAALARRQTRLKPTILHDSKNNGQHPKSKPIDISEENYEAILEGMRLCGETGTSKLAKVRGMSLAAKTGTGQARLNGKDVSAPWFMGFAPVEDPQIALVVLVEGLDKTPWGSTTACPIARSILSFYYQKYYKSQSVLN